MSEFLRRYQISGEVPDKPVDPMLAFWAAWMIGCAKKGTATTFDEARELAIKAAEFIENQAA